EDEARGWDARRVDGLRAVLAAQLLGRGVPQAQLDGAVARAAGALAACLADGRGRWLLGPQREARNEYRLSALAGGERRELVIDRMFVDAEGRTWIVDYKTSTHEGADRERFLDAERDRYAAQLEGYAAAAAPGGARLGLYFPLLEGWREWPAAAPRAALTE
ncbi:MAG TPA: PD-(D/E)XK nuclease family protein, partial [Myxococcota bacterium]|nr:PD-(D/E)XK nuclease family protein [Myxococcota bacterium]